MKRVTWSGLFLMVRFSDLFVYFSPTLQLVIVVLHIYTFPFFYTITFESIDIFYKIYIF